MAATEAEHSLTDPTSTSIQHVIYNHVYDGGGESLLGLVTSTRLFLQCCMGAVPLAAKRSHATAYAGIASQEYAYLRMKGCSVACAVAREQVCEYWVLRLICLLRSTGAQMISYNINIILQIIFAVVASGNSTLAARNTLRLDDRALRTAVRLVQAERGAHSDVSVTIKSAKAQTTSGGYASEAQQAVEPSHSSMPSTSATGPAHGSYACKCPEQRQTCGLAKRWCGAEPASIGTRH